MLLLSVVLAYIGMMTLCLAMNRHYRQVVKRPPRQRLQFMLRLCGWGILVLLFALCVGIWGWSIGPVAWFGVLSAGGLLLVFILPYAPRLAVIVGAVGSLPAVAGAFLVLAR